MKTKTNYERLTAQSTTRGVRAMFRKTAVLCLGTLMVIVTMAIAHAQPAYAATLYDDALSYWNFDNGTANDSIGANNGIVNGATWTSSGKIGSAYSFDGTNDYIQLTPIQSVMGSANYSMGAWVKAAASSRNQTILSVAPNGSHEIRFELNYSRNSELDFITYESGYGNVTSSATVMNDTYHYVTITKNGTTGTVYVNGILRGSGTVKNVLGTASYSAIGAESYGSLLAYFLGTIDEVAVWNRTLNSNEISALYATGYIASASASLGLAYDTTEMNQLAYLYYQGKEGLDPGSVSVDGMTWQYYSGALPGQAGHSIGDSYTYNGKTYIYLGSGLEGGPTGGDPAVPEPATVVSVIGGIFMAAYRKFLKRKGRICKKQE